MLVAPKSKAGRRTIKLPDALRAHRVHQPEERLAAANIWQDGGSHWGPTPTWSLSWRRRQPIGSGSPCGAERAPLAHTVAQGEEHPLASQRQHLVRCDGGDHDAASIRT